MIRPAVPADELALQSVYAAARRFMAASGNPHQWGDTKPDMAVIAEDIRRGQLYVEELDGRVCAAFALVWGIDPTYKVIDGAWCSDSPYGTVHRLASDGTRPGFFDRCMAFCRERIAHLRIDTHADNAPMRHLVAKQGFVYCGIIHLADGSPRLAFEWENNGQNTQNSAT